MEESVEETEENRRKRKFLDDVWDVHLAHFSSASHIHQSFFLLICLPPCAATPAIPVLHHVVGGEGGRRGRTVGMDHGEPAGSKTVGWG